MNEQELRAVSSNFDESSFLSDVMKIACEAGKDLMLNALKLWYVLDKPELPAKVRATIVGSLAYLVLPIDAVPDFIPGGYIDDMGALLLALGMASTYVDKEIESKAQVKLENILS